MQIESAIRQSQPRREYKENMLKATITMITIGCFILLSFMIVDPPQNSLLFASILLLTIASQSVAYLGILRDKVDHAMQFNIIFLSVIIIYVSYLSGGIYSSLTLLFTIPIILSITSLSVRFSGAIVMLFILSFLGLFAIEIAGYLPYAPAKDLLFRIVILTAIVIITSIIVGYHMLTMYRAESQIVALHRKAERLQVHQQMTMDLAHDLKTPISVLGTSSYIIRKRHSMGMDIEEKIILLDSHIEKLNHMVDGFLELSKLDAIEIDNPKSHVPIDLGKLLKSVIDDCFEYAHENHIDLFLNNDVQHPVVVCANWDMMKRAFENLVMNGIHYSKSKGHVRVSLSVQDNMAIIRVSDNGIGISSELHEKIFERFYRVNEARTTHSQSGSGIGLSIVQRIVEFHGGTVDVNSDLGNGSVFTVKLAISTQHLITTDTSDHPHQHSYPVA